MQYRYFLFFYFYMILYFILSSIAALTKDSKILLPRQPMFNFLEFFIGMSGITSEMSEVDPYYCFL